jgi:hypothetical protein
MPDKPCPSCHFPHWECDFTCPAGDGSCEKRECEDHDGCEFGRHPFDLPRYPGT